jgi:hypothetical protein
MEAAKERRCLLAAPSKLSRLILIPWIDDLMALKIPECEPLLDPILPAKGLIMIHAKRGIENIPSADKPLRWSAPKARPVLYVDGEMTLVDLQKRVAALKAGFGVNIANDHFRLLAADHMDVPDLATQAGQRMLDPLLDGVDLLIIETYRLSVGQAATTVQPRGRRCRNGFCGYGSEAWLFYSVCTLDGCGSPERYPTSSPAILKRPPPCFAAPSPSAPWQPSSASPDRAPVGSARRRRRTGSSIPTASPRLMVARMRAARSTSAFGGRVPLSPGPRGVGHWDKALGGGLPFRQNRRRPGRAQPAKVGVVGSNSHRPLQYFKHLAANNACDAQSGKHQVSSACNFVGCQSSEAKRIAAKRRPSSHRNSRLN